MQTVSVDGSSPSEVIGKVFRGHTMEVIKPVLESAVIRIDVLDMIGAPDANPGGEIDRLMGQGDLLREIAISRVSVADQQAVRIEYRRQASAQLLLGHRSLADHKIQCLPRTISYHEYANLPVRDAPFGRRAPTLARLSRQLPSAFLGFKQVGFIGFP